MRWIRRLVVVLLVVPLVGCVDESNIVETITLTVAVPTDRDSAVTVQIEDFARAVSTATDGAVLIKPVYLTSATDANLGDGVEAGQQAIRGDFDMAVTPTDSWDLLDVTSLEPLSAPFIIQNPNTLRLVADDSLAGELMAGLPKVGVTGLALWPNGLTHPFADTVPLLSAADFTGSTIRIRQSKILSLVYGVLGADQQVRPTGPVRGWEATFAGSVAGVATGNVSFHPSVSVLVINSDSAAKLTPRSMDVLQAAAYTVRDSATTMATAPEAMLASGYCGNRGSVVIATVSDWSALIGATQSVTELVAEDGDNAHIIDVIRRYEVVLPIEWPAACGVTGSG